MNSSAHKNLRLLLMLSVLTGAFFIPSEAEARIRLGVGTNYWFDHGGLFDLTLAPSAIVGRNFEVGGRFGAFVATSPNTLGIPADLFVRGNFDNLYFEFMGGPWIRFADDPLIGHAGFGFGVNTRTVSVGIEIGYLSPNPIAGLKLGFRL